MHAILDTDIGSDIDDAMALLLCLRLADLRPRAITTVYGKVELRARIAKKLVDLAGVDVPVAVGECMPISSPMGIWHTGEEGRGLLEPNEVARPVEGLGIHFDAVQLLIELAAEGPAPLDIIAIGPLTNIARAIQREPRFAEQVGRIWAMIGGISYPDTPPDRPLAPGEAFIAQASHNVRCDVGATRIVLESGIPVTMVGNDVTTRVRFNAADIQGVEGEGSTLNRAVMSLMRVWLAYRAQLFGRPVTWTCLHDALVVAEAYGMGFTQRDPVDVDLSDDGITHVTANPKSHIDVSRAVDRSAFEQWYLGVVTASV